MNFRPDNDSLESNSLHIPPLRSDLRNNKLNEIQDGSLHGADMLQDLLLSNNQLRQISPKMFANLRNLTTL